MAVLLIAVWRWKWWLGVPVMLVFFIVDGAYFAANATKIPDGGWFPLLVGAFAFTLLTTWAKGRRLMRERMSEVGLPLEIFAKSAPGRRAQPSGHFAEVSTRPMTLLLAAVGAVVTALIELSVAPYLRIGDAQPHPVLVLGVIVTACTLLYWRFRRSGWL